MSKPLLTYFLNSRGSDRFVRYDVIKIDDHKFLVKVTDTREEDTSHPKMLMEIHEKLITEMEYEEKFGIGKPQTFVRSSHPPSFEQYVEQYCKEHRNSID